MLLMWGSAIQAVPTHSSTEAEFLSADTGARNLPWMSNLVDELKIPMQKQPARLILNVKPSTKYHDGIIVKNQANSLHLLVNKKKVFQSQCQVNIADTYGPRSRQKG